MRTPWKTLRKSPAKRGGLAQQRRSSEASKTVVAHKLVKGWTQNLEQNSELARRFQTELVFSLLFDVFGIQLVLLLPPPAQGCPDRWQGEEIDERVEYLAIFSCSK